MNKKLGIVGGLGPLAGAQFLKLLTDVTDAKIDQDHIDSILISYASTPDRTDYIIGKSVQSPAPKIIEALQTLENLGVANIAIACVTAYYFFDELQAATAVPLLNMPKLTATFLKENGVKKAGIAATTGTIKTKLYQKYLDEADIQWAIPSDQGQNNVMELIYGQIKAGKPYDESLFRLVVDELYQDGCDCIILGSTELSTIKDNAVVRADVLDTLPVPLADSLEILAVYAALASGVGGTREALKL